MPTRKKQTAKKNNNNSLYHSYLAFMANYFIANKIITRHFCKSKNASYYSAKMYVY